MEKLPIELIVENLKQLSLKDLNNMCISSKFIKNVCDEHENEIYKNLIKKEFELSDVSPKNIYKLFNLMSRDSNCLFYNKINFFTRMALETPKLLEFYKKVGFDFTTLLDGSNNSIIQAILINTNDILKIKPIVHYYSNFNNKNKHSENILHQLMKMNLSETNVNMIRDIMNKLSKKALIQKNKNKETPFFLALLNQSYDVINLFLQKGEIYEKKYNQLVLKNKNVNVFKELLETSFTNEMIFDLIDYRNIDVFKYIINKYPEKINTQDSEGNTLLFKCFLNTEQDMASYLLSKGADVNIQNVNGDTVLHLFYLIPQINYRMSEMEIFLIEKGDMSIKNVDDLTPKDNMINDENYAPERYDF